MKIHDLKKRVCVQIQRRGKQGNLMFRNSHMGHQYNGKFED